MNAISYHAVFGAFIAAALALGANAGSDNRVSSAAPAHSVLNVRTQALLADLSEAYRACRDEVLDDALDAVGEIAAHLKQH
jgi:hypothetical protein